MGRILKEPEERKAEILDAAEYLFIHQGFTETSVNDINQKAGIAKGTFYYYFKSKEEVLDSVIDRDISKNYLKILTIAEEPTISAIEKFKRIILINRENNQAHNELLEFLHKKENIVMHQKNLVQAVRRFAPLFAEIIKQGKREGQFTTQYPQEVAEFLLVGTNFLFDTSIFPWTPEEYAVRINALQEVFEKSLGAATGSFGFLTIMSEVAISKMSRQNKND